MRSPAAQSVPRPTEALAIGGAALTEYASGKRFDLCAILGTRPSHLSMLVIRMRGIVTTSER